MLPQLSVCRTLLLPLPLLPHRGIQGTSCMESWLMAWVCFCIWVAFEFHFVSILREFQYIFGSYIVI